MLLSMTGYGKGEASYANRKIIVEIKSLNSKNLDIITHITPAYLDKELLLRQMITGRVVRGKVDLTVRVEDSAGDSAAVINPAIVGSYVEQIRTISRELNIEEPRDWWGVIGRMPGVTQTATPAATTDQEWQAVSKALDIALNNFTAFRQQEGEAVSRKFEEKLRNIAAYLKAIEPYEAQRTDKIRQQIVDRLNSVNANYDRNRLEEEMIYYIEKLDINEEKQRLANHLQYFADTMSQSEPQGKKLGFIAQEMGREINTLGSKSNQAEMQNLVVKMKDELEQIKEQVLNIL
ncbi:MAG: YicC family protein [Bacteroidaceae bacterium]|nr:YicC family protein [Bacteroidaceae bacterium]